MPASRATTAQRVVTNATSLGAANVWRIAISFATQLLIARKLGLTALGDYTIVIAWLNVGQILCEAGLPALYVRATAGRPPDQIAWRRRVWHIQAGLALAVWAALVAATAVIPRMANRLDLMIIGGALLPFYAFGSAATSYFEAAERMERIFFIDSISNTLLFAATVGVLLTGGTLQAIMVVAVLAQMAAALLTLIFLARKSPVPQPGHAPPPSAMLRQAFPFFGLSLADIVLQRGDLLLLSLVARPEVAGVYAAANSIARVAIKLVSSYWRALLPTLGRLHDQSSSTLDLLDRQATRLLALGTLPVAAFGAALSAPLVTLLFGTQTATVHAATVSAVALLLWTGPLYGWELRATTWMVILKRQRTALALALFHVACMLLAIPPLTAAAGAAGSAAASLGVGALSSLAAGWLLHRSGRPLYLADIARMTAAAVGTGALLVAAQQFLHHASSPIVMLGFAVTASALFFVLCIAIGVINTTELSTLYRAIRRK